MTHGFQQQDTALGSALRKSAAPQQHGQKPLAKPPEVKEPRSFKPRPGH